MAQLRDSIITGSLRVTDAIYSTTVQAQILKAPTASNGATYGPGTDKQVIRSNGTSSYWGSLGAAADYAIDDATSNGALGTGTGLTTERSVYYGLVTVNNASQTRATGIYAPTSAGTANQILVSSGGTSAPTWKATAAGAAYATSSNGALTFGTLGAGYGGTGQSTYTIGDILYSNAANTLAKLNGNTTTTNKFLRSVATTSGTAVAPTWSEVTKTDVGLSNVTNDAQVKASLGTTKGDMLYWTGNAAPARLGIGTAGYTLQATADGPAWTQTVAVANGGTGATSFTANCAIISGSTTTSALTTRAITNNTTATAVTASTNLITANTLYYHTGNSNLTTVGTITTGTWNATTIGAGYGGTGQSTYTVGDILYCGTANTLSKLGGNTTTTRKFLRSVATTSGTAVAPAWDTVTKTDVGLSNVTNDAQVKASLGTAKGDMLYWSASATPARLAIGTAGYFLKATANGPVWANTTDITALGTITTGTWNGSKIDVSYLSSSTANRLVWSQSTGTFIAGNHYASTTQVSIASTTAPDSEYALKVNGNLEAAGVINIITNTRTKDLYFSNGTPGSCGVAGRIMYDIGTGPNITKSLMCFVENSYSPTASATPIIYGEYYYLPACTAGLTQNLSYTILTTKSTVTTAQGGTGVASHTANRLVYSTSATAIQATDAHYVSATQMSINFNSAPHSGYTLLVGGHSEINGALSLQQPNSSTQSLYFKNHTSTVLGVGARIYYWNGSASGITHSQLNFQEYSYSTTASATPLSFYEQYSLPDCTAGLGANAAYNILTDKNVYPFPMCARQVNSSMTFDNMNAPGVYAVANNISSSNSYPTSQTNAKYGILVVFGGTNSNNTAGNAMQLWFSGITNAGYYKLAIRAKYNGTWGAWSVIH